MTVYIVELEQALDALPEYYKGSSEQNDRVKQAADNLFSKCDFRDFTDQGRSRLQDALNKFKRLQRNGAFHRRYIKSETEKRVQKVCERFGFFQEIDEKLKLFDRFKSRSFNAEDIKKLQNYDQDFIFLALKELPYKSLINVLPNLPPIGKNLALKIGAILNMSESEEVDFAKSVKIDLTDLRLAINKYKAFRDNQSNLLMDEGICAGLTLALSSQSKPHIEEDTLRKARFLQACHTMHKILPEQNYTEIGKKAQPQDRPILFKKAKQLFGVDLPNSDPEFQNRIFGIIIYNIPKINIKNQIRKASASPRETREIEAEIRTLESIAERCGERGTYGSFSDPLLTSRGLKREIVTSSHEPIKRLFETLGSIKNRNGNFGLGLYSESTHTGHSIYVSLNPPAFCDPNSIHPLDLNDSFHKFKSVGEMLDKLREHMAFTYPKGHWTHFDIERFTKIS